MFSGSSGNNQWVQRWNSLSRNQQIGVIVVGVLVLYGIVSSSGAWRYILVGVCVAMEQKYYDNIIIRRS